MPRRKKELAEQIIPKLREVEVEAGRGKTVLEPAHFEPDVRKRKKARMASPA